QEHRNIDAAMDWFLSKTRPADALRLAWAVWPVWWRRGRLDEATRFVGRVLDQRGPLPPGLPGRALVGGAALERRPGQRDEARAAFEEARVLAREAGDTIAEARALGPLGSFAAVDGDQEAARSLMDQAYDLAVRTDEHWLVSLFHSRLGMIALGEGDP